VINCTTNKLLIALTSLALTGCDPVHQIKLDNETGKPVIIIYRPLIEISPARSKVESFDIDGITYARTVLSSGEFMRIGNVVARYTPRPDDIELDFLEVCIDKDTMKLIGKKSILSAIQKVDKLDWRLLLKDK
jgi:hypothetical protein